MPMTQPQAVLTPSTDHAGIQVKIKGTAAEALGKRMETHAAITDEHIEVSKQEEWQERISEAMGNLRTHGINGRKKRQQAC